MNKILLAFLITICTLTLYGQNDIVDFGDAPDSYGAADHRIDFINYFGSAVDGEAANQPSAAADADDINGIDDEDGVTFPALIRGTTVLITITVTGDGYVNAWFDWNGNGNFNDSGERVISDLSRGDETFTRFVIIPVNAVISAPTFARFRFGPRRSSGYSQTGSASYGEAEDYQITILCAPPSPPVIGTIIQPTCSVSTGSVMLNGLPSSGPWTLIRYPEATIITGTGTSRVISGLAQGTYTFTVTNAENCTSALSGNVVINAQPETPSAPVPGAVNHPTCVLPTGSVLLNGLPSGTWTINPGSVTGSTTSIIVSGLAPGTHNFTVTNSTGCISLPTSDVIINAQPQSPASPLQTTDCSLGFNHAIITVTNPVGPGFVYRLDDGAFQASTSFTGVINGIHTITARNDLGCSTTGPGFSVSCSCVNGPTVTLSALSGDICGTTTPLTIMGNTFGGSATSVTITDNGAGSVSPSFANTSLFEFTYTPAAGDEGKSVIITVTTDNPLGAPCEARTAFYTLTFQGIPAAPSVGIITQPACIVPTGSVTLTGLPSTGTWILTRGPDGVITTGLGTIANISGLLTGTYTFTVTSVAGCTSGISANVVINSPPGLLSAPIIGLITHPTCIQSTGSVVLSGLPATKIWTLVRNPGGVTITGSGTTRTVSGLFGGTYTFTVINSDGCTSLNSANVIINPQPVTPGAPVPGIITQPPCTVSTGNVVLNGLPATGIWTLTRYPGTIQITGAGTGTTVPDLPTGIYNFTVTNSEGCISTPSGNILIAEQPPTPTAPLVGAVTQPTCVVTSGSVILTGLPSSGQWTLTRTPGELTTIGTGTSTSVSGLLVGSYTFTVTNSTGCISPPSGSVLIPANPSVPIVIITNPAPVCSPAKVNLTVASVTAGSTQGLTYTYWTNPGATIPYSTPATANTGTYYIKGTTTSLCSDIKVVTATIRQKPLANAGPDQVLEYIFNTDLEANTPGINETGNWSIFSGSGKLVNPASARTSVSDLAAGKNVFLWSVTNGVCPPTVDSVKITVHDLVIPTLITPNNDGKNEYFLVRGIQSQGKTELVIFDRRGKQVYINRNYDNKWNGIDYNGNPLPDDTYFFLLKSGNGKSRTGFIVIRQ